MTFPILLVSGAVQSDVHHIHGHAFAGNLFGKELSPVRIDAHP